MRVGLLFCTGDPVTAAIWLRSYPNIRPDIDKLIVSFISKKPLALQEATASLFPIGTEFKYYEPIDKEGIRYYSAAINTTLQELKPEDIFVFLHEDGFFLEPSILDKTFGYIEKGIADVIGSKCGPCCGKQRITAR